MREQYELQETTVGELIAQALESEAKLMPPSCREQAAILLKRAADFREYQREVIRVWRSIAPPKA